jgi:hypothetical protein
VVAHLRAAHDTEGKLVDNLDLVTVVSEKDVPNPSQQAARRQRQKARHNGNLPARIPPQVKVQQPEPTKFRRLDGFILLGDDIGGVWIAEKIR